jgi:hypothetical protein
MAIHTGEKGEFSVIYNDESIRTDSVSAILAYICPEAGCHRSFSVRSNMSRHVRNVHKIWPDGNEEASDSGDEVEQP